MTSCCFTGHRPDKLSAHWHGERSPERLLLRDAVAAAVRDGCTVFYSGMALGADTLAAEEVLRLRDGGAAVKLFGAIPYPEQPNGWSEVDRERYKALLSRLDGQILIAPEYRTGCLQQRNHYMVDNTEAVIALYNGASSGGTAGTIAYARKCGRKIRVLRIGREKSLLIPRGNGRYALRGDFATLLTALSASPLCDITEIVCENPDDPLGAVLDRRRYGSVSRFLHSDELSGASLSYYRPQYTVKGNFNGVDAGLRFYDNTLTSDVPLDLCDWI